MEKTESPKSQKPLLFAGFFFLLYLANVLTGKASMFLIGSPKVFLKDVLEFLVLLGASAFFVIAILISEFKSEGVPNQSKMEM